MASDKAEVISFETAEGTKVTCSVELAQKLGYSAPKKSTAKKTAVKTEATDKPVADEK